MLPLLPLLPLPPPLLLLLLLLPLPPVRGPHGHDGRPPGRKESSGPQRPADRAAHLRNHPGRPPTRPNHRSRGRVKHRELWRARPYNNFILKCVAWNSVQA